MNKVWRKNIFVGLCIVLSLFYIGSSRLVCKEFRAPITKNRLIYRRGFALLKLLVATYCIYKLLHYFRSTHSEMPGGPEEAETNQHAQKAEDLEDDWSNISSEHIEYELKKACESGNINKVRYLIKTRNGDYFPIKLNSNHKEVIKEDNLVDIALKNGHDRVARYIISEIKRDDIAYTWREFCRNGTLEEVAFFVEKMGIDPNEPFNIKRKTYDQFPYGEIDNPLAWASIWGRYDIVQYLIEKSSYISDDSLVETSHWCRDEERFNLLLEKFDRSTNPALLERVLALRKNMTNRRMNVN